MSLQTKTLYGAILSLAKKFFCKSVHHNLAARIFLVTIAHLGEVSEWLKEHAWKVCIRLRVSRVRIPLSPPEFMIMCLHEMRKLKSKDLSFFCWYRLRIKLNRLKSEISDRYGLKHLPSYDWKYYFQTNAWSLDQNRDWYKYDYLPQWQKSFAMNVS